MFIHLHIDVDTLGLSMEEQRTKIIRSLTICPSSRGAELVVTNEVRDTSWPRAPMPRTTSSVGCRRFSMAINARIKLKLFLTRCCDFHSGTSRFYASGRRLLISQPRPARRSGLARMPAMSTAAATKLRIVFLTEVPGLLLSISSTPHAAPAIGTGRWQRRRSDAAQQSERG